MSSRPPNVRVRPKRPIERMSDFRAPSLGSGPAENHPNQAAAYREHRTTVVRHFETPGPVSSDDRDAPKADDAAVAHHAGDSLANVIPNHERASIRSG